LTWLPLSTPNNIDDEIGRLEDVFKKKLSSTLNEFNIQVDCFGCSSTVHLYVVSSNLSNPKDTLVLIHGVSSSTVTYFPVIDELSKEFDIVLIDLPGFGRSTCTKIPKHENVAEFYSMVLKQCLLTLNIMNPVTFIGHSFGAYLSVYFSNHHPEMVSKLILFSPAGTFSHLGLLSEIWSIVFKFSNSFGKLRFLLSKKHDIDLYWDLLRRNSSGFGDVVVANHIHFRPFNSKWNKPSFDLFNEIKIKTSIVFGSDDAIIPCSDGEVLSKHFGFQFYRLNNVGHAIFESKDSFEAIINIVKS
jgi:pimeloyl-ACP methyl ester carboxylesterase